jgi:hypothetical protein
MPEDLWFLDDQAWWLQCAGFPAMTMLVGGLMTSLSSASGMAHGGRMWVADVWKELVLAALANAVLLQVATKYLVGPRMSGVAEFSWTLLFIAGTVTATVGVALALVARLSWDPSAHAFGWRVDVWIWLLLTLTAAVSFVASVILTGRGL